MSPGIIVAFFPPLYLFIFDWRIIALQNFWFSVIHQQESAIGIPPLHFEERFLSMLSEGFHASEKWNIPFESGTSIIYLSTGFCQAVSRRFSAAKEASSCASRLTYPFLLSGWKSVNF